MKYAILGLLLIVILPMGAQAEWAMIELDELVQDSDLIVVGTLRDVSEYTKEGTDYASGNIIVDEVIWGNLNVGDKLTLSWQNPSGLLCPRVEHRGNDNIKAIWLLTTDDNVNVEANYPGRFVKLNERAKVIDALMKRTVRLKITQNNVSPNEPIEASIIFRNPSDREKAYPGIEYKEGVLYIDPQIKLKLFRVTSHFEEIPYVSNKLIIAKTIAPIIVGANQEYKISFNLRDIFDISTENSYSLSFSMKGYSKINQAYFHQGSRPQPEEPVSLAEKLIEPLYRRRNELMLGLILSVLMLSTGLVIYRFRRSRRPI